MLHSKKVICVIPARLNSSRFPNKILINLLDKPLLQWVWEAACRVRLFDRVVFAIDDEKTAHLIESFNGQFHMTPKDLVSGTDRVGYLQKENLETSDIWVNWQCDEPLIGEKMIEDLLSQGDEKADVWTLKKKIVCEKDVHNPHIAKVVTDANGYALYFSRSPIPYYRDERNFEKMRVFQHIGLYAYTSDALARIIALPPCDSEEAEKLEQLRYLHFGLKVKVNLTEESAFGIDLKEHQAIAENYLREKFYSLETSPVG